jgi:hypothetical protein
MLPQRSTSTSTDLCIDSLRKGIVSAAAAAAAAAAADDDYQKVQAYVRHAAPTLHIHGPLQRITA